LAAQPAGRRAHKRLRHVVAEDDHTRLRLLSERRDDLARERVRLLNRLHVLLRDLIPGGAELDLTADKAATLLRSIRPVTVTDSRRGDLARDMMRIWAIWTGACTPRQLRRDRPVHLVPAGHTPPAPGRTPRRRPHPPHTGGLTMLTATQRATMIPSSPPSALEAPDLCARPAGDTRRFDSAPRMSRAAKGSTKRACTEGPLLPV
jgi:hypothetical protein